MKFYFFKTKKIKKINKMEMARLELPWDNFYFIAMTIKLASYFYSNILIQDIYDHIKYESFDNTFAIIHRLLFILQSRDIWLRIQPITTTNLFESYDDRILINKKIYYIKDVEYFMQFNKRTFILLTS